MRCALFDQFTPENLTYFKPQIAKMAEEEKRRQRELVEAEREAGEIEDHEAIIARALAFYDENVLILHGGCEYAIRECLIALGTKVTVNPVGKDGTIEVTPFGATARD
jgi:hypothetical protein